MRKEKEAQPSDTHVERGENEYEKIHVEKGEIEEGILYVKRGEAERKEIDVAQGEETRREINVQSEDVPMSENSIEEVAWTSIENKDFLTIRLGSLWIRALVDKEAMVSLVNQRIAEKYEDKLEPSSSYVEAVLDKTEKCLGDLRVTLEVDGVPNTIIFKVMRNIKHDMILGIEFMRKWDIETKCNFTRWRVGETLLDNGEWHSFGTDEDQTTQIYAQCAGIIELTESEQEKLDKLLEELFNIPDNPDGLQLNIEHRITLKPGSKPVRQGYRRMSPKMEKFAREEVEKMLADDVIEPSVSEWCSRPVIAKKDNGELRFCVDYRDLNKCTEIDAYPIVGVDKALDKLRKAKYITKIDLKKAFWQIKLAPESRKYTAFAISGSGLWQFEKMTYGLNGAPKTFERALDEILTPEFDPYVTRYMDDFIITTETFEEHVD